MAGVLSGISSFFSYFTDKKQTPEECEAECAKKCKANNPNMDAAAPVQQPVPVSNPTKPSLMNSFKTLVAPKNPAVAQTKIEGGRRQSMKKRGKKCRSRKSRRRQ
jgi:hypothetical protein